MWPADVQQAQLLVNRFVTDLINSAHELNGGKSSRSNSWLMEKTVNLSTFPAVPRVLERVTELHLVGRICSVPPPREHY